MTDHQPFIHNDIDGNSLTFHGGGQDDDGHPTVAVEADQIGRGTAWVHVRHTDAARVADELRAAAGLPPIADPATVLDDEATLIVRHCPDHGPQDQDGVWMDCHCPVADDMRKRAAEIRRLADETQQSETREWCKCPSCWGWFVEEHPGEDLDELGKDLGWWSGLPKHRDAPAAAPQPKEA